MKQKILMQNAKTYQLLITIAKSNGNVYKKYLKQGFKPIGYISGFDVSVQGFK